MDLPLDLDLGLDLDLDLDIPLPRGHLPPRHRRCLFSSPPPPPPPFPSLSKKGKRRGSYNCGRCGQPKRGHVCPDDPPEDDHIAPPTPQGMLDPSRTHASRRHAKPLLPSLPSSSPSSSCSSNELYRRALAASASFDASAHNCASPDSSALEPCPRPEEAMPLACMVHILSRLFPPDLVAASSVCRRWRQCAEYVWAAIREANLSISAPYNECKPSENDYVPFFLRKCSSLTSLSLNVFSQISDSLLKCIAALCPQLTSLEVSLNALGVNNVSGQGLRVFFRMCKSLTSVKLEGCRDIIELEISSTRLQVFWLTGCNKLKYMLLNCPNLSELSLDFLPHQEVGLGSHVADENTDHLAAIMKNLGNSARGLKRLHVASPWLHDRVVTALFSSGLKLLRMLSLTFGSGITDNSVATIASRCQSLELLDLSGSSITDKALELIYTSFSGSLFKLLVALCPKVSHVGLQTAVSQLPFLQLLDCGRVILDNCSGRTESLAGHEEHTEDSILTSFQSHSDNRQLSVLSLQHSRLEKLSLWGCSGLQVLMLDCPNLVDLNLTGCSNLKSEKLQLLCPSLKDIYVGKCEENLLEVIESQVEQALYDLNFALSVSRQADGSKRVQAPRISRKVQL